jgi:hypothetical protein
MATATRLGQAGLQGWREKVADGIAEPVARRAPLDSEQVRALLGAIFFVLSVLYVVKTFAAATRQSPLPHPHSPGSERRVTPLSSAASRGPRLRLS